jgi:NAD(P)-dependent dehydrogenase (short-subunit alcohol dehydrogenase family)
MKRFDGKVALVTGAGSGIGRATALAFAREEAKVVVADIAVADGEETVRLIKDGGGEAVFVKTDVSREKEVESLINTTIEIYGQLDCAHNNAGINGDLDSVTTCTEDNWDRVLGINLKGVWLCLKYEIPMIKKRGYGAIVNTSSTSGLVGSPGVPAYNASKHGVVGLTRTAALECAKIGIRVNAVCPGTSRTPFMQRLIDAGLEDYIISLVPAGRLGEPEETANTVLWLCSGEASFITGAIIAIDGGLTAQ